MSPERPPRPCAQPGCPNTVSGSVSRCPACRRNYFKIETARRTPNPFYKTALWERARRRYIRNHPFCESPGCTAAARTVDHIVPISAGGERLDPENFCSLCPSCDGYKRNLERHYSDYFLRLVDAFNGISWERTQVIGEIFDRLGGPRAVNIA